MLYTRDSRDDMVIKGPKGELHGYLNLGQQDSTSVDFFDVGQIASGTGNADISFGDLNNDGRDDILIWDKNGGLTGFINTRGTSEGKPIWGSEQPVKTSVGAQRSSCFIGDITGNGMNLSDILFPNFSDVLGLKMYCGSSESFLSSGSSFSHVLQV